MNTHMLDLKRKNLKLTSHRHVSASALVWFPKATWLGPLRWWVPWKVQAFFATAARLMGLAPIMERYVDKEDWEAIQKAKQL